jgi:GWxTD domain-containing protein
MSGRLRPVASLLFLLLFALVASAADDPVLTTFLQAKSLYRSARYADADDALRRLGELIAAPEFASVRPKVLPAYLFYSAAVAFERKDEPRAKESLKQYFAIAPNAALDPSAYPKSFGKFFEAEKTKLASANAAAAPPPGMDSIGGNALPDYASFVPEASFLPVNDGAESWTDSPVRWLLTDDDKRGYRALADDDARRRFVTEFWRRLDPRPDTNDNEYEAEFYRRAQYCDARFSTESVRGSLSDRGMVFIVMGPPTFASRSVLKNSEDLMTVLENTEVVSFGSGHITRVDRKGASTIPGEADGEAESWYYRGERIPKGVPYNEVIFQFFTRKGYGVGVLQKDPRQLTTLAKVQRMIREGRTEVAVR